MTAAPAAPDPRAALGNALAAQLTMLLGTKVAATWVLNPPPLGDGISTFALFSFTNGTSAAAVLIDLQLSCLLGAALLGSPVVPPAHVATMGAHPREVEEALGECCNVFAALLNAAQPERLKLTGMVLGPADLDLDELGACRIEYAVSITGLGAGRLVWFGRAAAAAAIKAARQEVESRALGPEGLGDTLSEVIGRMLGHAPTFKAGSRLTLAPSLRAAIPVFRARQGGGIYAVGVCEFSLAAMFGAAPTMIPKATLQEQTRAGKLSGTLLDGAHEIFNVMAAPFAHRKVYLEALYWLPGELPADVRALLPHNSTLPAWEVTVGDYGSGKFAMAGLR